MKKSAGIVIIYENSILLIHPFGNKRWYNSYSFPKGGLDKGESILDAALRETREEVGIKIKKSQLDSKMHEIEYRKKSGKIYKKVYYWICRIDKLKKIGLENTVVPKNQLQKSEVDWAGFVSGAEIEKRIAPVMKPIIKHINIREKYQLKSIYEYISNEYVYRNTEFIGDKPNNKIIELLKIYNIKYEI